MDSAIEKLRKVGLTEYEARAYMALLGTHVSTATQTAEKSRVPRTRIYSVLESLNDKGWVKINSGVPLLFKAVAPLTVFERAKEDYTAFLESINDSISKEVDGVKQKFVVKRFDIGLDGLKAEISKAKTVVINNTPTVFLKKVSDAFAPDAVIRIVMFPGEAKFAIPNAVFKEADVAIVTIIRNREVPSISITLDEERTFSAFQDPFNHNFVVDEMLYDECQRCFAGWSSMSWNGSQ